jgi:hypothetical protein
MPNVTVIGKPPTNETGKPAAQHGGHSSKSAAPSKEDRKAHEEQAKELHQKIVNAVPGSEVARELFEDLADQITELLPNVKHQVKFVSEACKSVWYKQQGDGLRHV